MDLFYSCCSSSLSSSSSSSPCRCSTSSKRRRRFLLVVFFTLIVICITNVKPASAAAGSHHHKNIRGRREEKEKENDHHDHSKNAKNNINFNGKNFDTAEDTTASVRASTSTSTTTTTTSERQEQGSTSAEAAVDNYDGRNLMGHIREIPKGIYTTAKESKVPSAAGAGRGRPTGEEVGKKGSSASSHHHHHSSTASTTTNHRNQHHHKEQLLPAQNKQNDHDRDDHSQGGGAFLPSAESFYYTTAAGEERHKISKQSLEIERVDHVGITHTRLQETIDDIPVFGHQEIVHHKPGEAAEQDRITRDPLPELIKDLNPVPTISMEDAIKTAKAYLEGGQEGLSVSVLEDATELNIFIENNDKVYLTFKVSTEVYDENGYYLEGKPLVFVDAHHLEGNVLHVIETLDTASLYDDFKATYYQKEGPKDENGDKTFTYPIGDSSDSVLTGIHRHVQSTLDFLATPKVQYKSYDDKGAYVYAIGHYGNRLNNAFWDGYRIVFGDGNPDEGWGHLGVLDVVAHELGHAVTTFSSDLVYENESGALNEAASDILGAAVEAYVDGEINDSVWFLGEDVLFPKALRYMNRPSFDGYSRDHYSNKYTGPDDHGGVHLNSGIANHWFYLLVVGGHHHNREYQTGTVVNGIGLEAAFDIWFEAWTDELTPSSTFQDARKATIEACKELGYDINTICVSVENAWAEVGVGDVHTGRMFNNTCANGEILVQLDIRTDKDASKDNSLSLMSQDGKTIWSVKSFQDSRSYPTFEACLASRKCYTLNFIDTYGNGFRYGGSFKLAVNGNIISNERRFGDGYTTEIGNCSSDTAGCDQIKVKVKTDHRNDERKLRIINTKTPHVNIKEKFFSTPFSTVIDETCLGKNECYEIRFINPIGLDYDDAVVITVNSKELFSGRLRAGESFIRYPKGCEP